VSTPLPEDLPTWSAAELISDEAIPDMGREL
jgi:hypothetical protein